MNPWWKYFSGMLTDFKDILPGAVKSLIVVSVSTHIAHHFTIITHWLSGK